MFYRMSAEKVEALIRPEDRSRRCGMAPRRAGAEVVSHSKVTSADKAATPQELLKKAQ